jgi:hypothetical protein
MHNKNYKGDSVWYSNNNYNWHDLADINTVTVNVSGQGDYEFSIDKPTGPSKIQISLWNVPAGLHEVYINR